MFTYTRTIDNFGSKIKSEIKDKPEQSKVTISSISMMKRARYRPEVNTKLYMKKDFN